nr:hypothetical protein CFP56_76353 [Quercus suber]
MTSFLDRMQASDISSVCNQVLQEIAQRAANIHPPAGVSQALRVKKFRKGLNFKIRERLTTSRVEDYKELVTLAEAVEGDIQERAKMKAVMEQDKGKTMKFNQPWKGKSSLNSSNKNTTKYLPRDVEKCAQCGRLHPGECRATNRTCFRCGKPGHFIKDCPINSNKGNSTTGSGQKRPMVQGRVFALTEQDAQAAPDVVSGDENENTDT